MGNNTEKDMIFKSLDSLQPVVNVVNEAAEAVNNPKRTIKDSPISDVLGGVIGASIGGTGSFIALYTLGIGGLSAAGITSALATAGAVVGGGMVAGVFVLAAPIVVLAGVGVAVAAEKRSKQLREEKERLYKIVLERHNAIIEQLRREAHASKERIDYLTSLNILLQQALKDLKSDLDGR